MAESVPLLDAAGIEHCIVSEVGNPYISQARSNLLRKALDTQPDAVVFLDHDLSWQPDALVKLIQTEGDVVAGTYRFKQDEEKYMGMLMHDTLNLPLVRKDGCIEAEWVPAGFLKITANAVNRFMQAYPHLTYGQAWRPYCDLFNHGAHNGIWYGEDYAFSRNWLDLGGQIWLIPNLNIDHHASSGAAYPGNFHNFMLRQPGGSDADNNREGRGDERGLS